MRLDRYNGLNIGDLTNEEVLFFVRIHGKKGIFGKYYPQDFLESFRMLTEFRTISEYSVGDVHIDLNKVLISEITYKQHVLFKEVLDIDEIILRCRALREISYAESRELIWRVAKFFDDYYNAHQELKLVVSLIVDNYVMDVMVRLAEHRNIEVIQLVGFFVPGYVRFTSKGLGVKIREVPESEVNRVLGRLLSKEKSHMAISKKAAINRVVKDYFSYRYRYLFRYLFKYRLLGRLEYEYRFAPYFHGFDSLKKLKAGSYYDSPDGIIENSVFIPLHYHPEATVDYWADKPEHADYLGSLLRVISFYRQIDVQVVFKEHPAYYLRRSIEFYKTLKSHDNVIIIDPFYPSQKLLESINKICVHTGSAGVEALITGKDVYKVTENYYSFSKLPYYDQFGKTYEKLTRNDKATLLKNILETTLPLD